MNKIFFSMVCLIFCLQIFPQPNWRWIAPNPPNAVPYSSVTIGNKIYFWCEHLRIMTMDIYTEEFRVIPVYPTNEYIGIGEFAQQGIGFADTLNGYIGGSSYGEYRTSNAGLSWIKISETYSNINLVAFASNRRGWKAGSGGLYITNNAGVSWSFVSAAILYGAGVFSKIFTLNENHLFILKSSYYNGNGASIFRSLNGGYNWTEINTGLQSDSLNQVKYVDLKINISGVGFAIGSIYHPSNNSYEGFIMKTLDFGNSWSMIKYPNEIYKDLLLLGDNDCVILGNSGYYPGVQVIQRKSSNQGSTWTLSLPFQTTQSWSYYYNAIFSPSNDAIYMISTAGIYKSTSRGDLYFKLTSEQDLFVSNIVFDSRPLNPNRQLAISWLQFNKQPYLISTDAGYTWIKKSLPQSMGYVWLVGIAEEVIYLIADQVRLYKSTNFGDSWTLLNVPVYSGLQALSVYSKDIFTLRAYQYLVSSTDGGNTWIKGPLVDYLWLYQTNISNIGTVVGVGSYYFPDQRRGAFYRTTDYGLSWHIFDTEAEIMQLSMVSSNFGFAIDNRRIFRTSNAGTTWNVINSFNRCDAFAFYDSLNGVVYANSWLQKTQNAGSSWVNLYLGLPVVGVSKMTCNILGDLFIIGGGSLVMLPCTFSSSSSMHNSYKEVNHDLNLFQNYPNPFNPTTRIQYQVSSSSHVTLKVCDVLGNEVATLVDEYRDAGRHEIEFDASKLASGVYYYQLRAGDFVQTKKMLLLR